MSTPFVPFLSLRFAALNLGLCVCALATLLLPVTAQAQTTYSGGGSISISLGDTSTHSSTLSVTGATGPVATAYVELKGVVSNGGNTTFSVQGTQWMLKSPNGQEFAFLGYTGDGTDGGGLSGLNIFVEDAASTDAPWGGPPNQAWPQTGTSTVKPSSYDYYGAGGFTPVLPGTVDPAVWPQFDGCSPDPATYDSGCSAATFSSTMSGATGDGTWTLYMNDSEGDPVSITGWSLTLTYSAAEATTTTVSSSATDPSFNPAPTSPGGTVSENSMTFTATVSAGSGTPTGTVTFTSNGASICNAVAVSGGTAHCTASLPTGYSLIDASYTATGSFANSSGSMTQLVEVPGYNPSGNTWCNYSPVSISGAGVPIAYPSIINVSDSAYNGKTVGTVSIELIGATTTESLGGQYLLVAPTGGAYNLDFMDDDFTGVSASNVNLTFSDSGTSPYNVAPTTGTYLPWDASQNITDTFQALQSPQIDPNIPAVPVTPNYPQTRGGTNAYTFEEAFNGAPANGEWSLYMYAEPVTLNGGYCITFDINPGTATTTAVTSSAQKGTTGQSVTISATVTSGGSPVTSGTVTFVDTTFDTTLASGVTVNSSGVATYTSSTFTEGDHKITATYNGTSNYNTSFGTMWQREDDATTVSAVNSSTWRYCNTGQVTIPMSTHGPYTPNPSNIFVTNLPGTLNTVSLTLKNFSILVADQLLETATLVEGPTGAALDFFSNTAQGTGGSGGSDEATLGNYTFEDSASSLVPEGVGNISPGTYKPTSYLNPETLSADVFTSSASGFYNAPSSFVYSPTIGTATFADEFTSGSNANGAWSLFFDSGNANASGTGAAGGWCVNLTENLPAATVDLTSASIFAQGQQGAYMVSITDNGPGSTGDPTAGSNPMTVTDTLNSAFSYAGFSGAGWSCSPVGQTVTCTNDSAVAMGIGYPQLTINVNVTGTGNVSNTVVASGAGVSSTLSNTDTVTIDVPPAITSASSTTFAFGSAGSFSVTATGTPTPGLTESGALPPGVTFTDNGNGTATLAGTPTSYGIFPITITANNGASPPANQSFTLTVPTPMFVLTTAANPAAGGSVTPASGSSYTAGTVEPISATANSGYTFVSWSSSPGTVAGAASASTTITMNAAETVTAQFAANLAVTVATDDNPGVAGNCTAQPTPGTGTDTSCSLRDALAFAANAGAANITFASATGQLFATPQTIALGSAGALNIPSNTTITGATSGLGATLTNLVTVSGAGAVTVFNVNSAVTGSQIGNLTISDGNDPAGSSAGGILNQGSLTIGDCTISGNREGTGGGGIANVGTLTVNNSTISGNAANTNGANPGFGGGGIYNEGNLIVNNSTISGNTSNSNGGGIYSDEAGIVTVNNSTVSGNTASLGEGGGIYSTATLTLANSISAGNTEQSNGDVTGAYTDKGGNQVGVSGINLAPLGNYGGPTQTLDLLPGSTALCAGTLANATAASVATDQRGFELDPVCPAGSVDSGALQTHYTLGFAPLPLNIVEGQVIAPAPAVTLYESAMANTTATNAVTLSDTGATLSGTLTQDLVAGVATFPGISFTSLGLDTELTATMALTSTINITGQRGATVTVSPAPAVISSPAQGSTLTGPELAFSWNSVGGATGYSLWVGTAGVGSNNLYDSGQRTATSLVFANLPTNGATVYVRLYTIYNGVANSNDYTYTASTQAALTSPQPSSQLSGAKVTFTWSAATGASGYSLWLGSSQGTHNLYDSGEVTGASATATRLPTNGSTVWARIYTTYNGLSRYTDYTYTAQ